MKRFTLLLVTALIAILAATAAAGNMSGLAHRCATGMIEPGDNATVYPPGILGECLRQLDSICAKEQAALDQYRRDRRAEIWRLFGPDSTAARDLLIIMCDTSITGGDQIVIPAPIPGSDNIGSRVIQRPFDTIITCDTIWGRGRDWFCAFDVQPKSWREILDEHVAKGRSLSNTRIDSMFVSIFDQPVDTIYVTCPLCGECVPTLLWKGDVWTWCCRNTGDRFEKTFRPKDKIVWGKMVRR